MPLKIGQRYNIGGIGKVLITSSRAKGKKKVAIRESDGKRINFGAKGFRIKPGKDAGDSFCARSMGGNKVGFNANTLARLDWHCKGKSTSKKLPKTVKPLPKKRKK